LETRRRLFPFLGVLRGLYRSRTVRTLVVYVLAILTSATAAPQVDEWRIRMDEGKRAEDAGDFAAASRSYRSATEVAERFDRTDQRRAAAWNALAMMDDAMGQLANAVSEYRRALKAAEESSGKASSNYALVLGNLGTVYAEMGQNARGEKLVREALAFYVTATPRDELRVAAMQNCLAEVLLVRRKYGEAEGLLIGARAVLEKHPEDPTDLGVALNNLGALRVYKGEYAEGERLLMQALETIEKRMGPDHPLLLRTLSNLASVAGRMGNREAAGARLNRAMDLAGKRLGADHPLYGILLANYAAYLREGGDKSGAKAVQARSVQILKNSGRSNGIGAVVDISALKGQ